MKICFVTPHAYSLLNNSTSFGFGGSELRATLFANGIAAHDGYEVSFIVFNHGQRAVEEYEKIKAFALPHEFGVSRVGLFWRGMRILNRLCILMLSKLASFINPKPLVTMKSGNVEIVYERPHFKTYDVVDADVYLVVGVTNLAGDVAAYCNSRKKIFILLTASDFDMNDIYYEGSTEINRYGNIGYKAHYALSNAELIITQTESQKQKCLELFERDSVVIKNPVVPMEQEMGRDNTRDGSVVWIGKSDRNKQPQILISVARMLPNVTFHLVMSVSSQSFHDRILNICPKNVIFHSGLKPAGVFHLLSQSSVFVCTARLEGFPNSYLQAAVAGVPISSLHVNPDNFITDYACGFCSNGDIELLSENIRKLLDDYDLWRRSSENIIKYAKAVHDTQTQINLFSDVLQRHLSHDASVRFG